ncbi:hypothetical protein [Methylococcus capsulatus]|uniref:hypothetical protein n=1 Tax=Methylococcus capsulatus TaxID=414 RepID=UPI00117D55A2|nr:hypothetical protein [Methylococcus capsulatus]
MKIRVPFTTIPGTKWRSKAIVRGESKESTGITRSSGHRRVVEAVGRNERPDPLGGKPRQKLDADAASSTAWGVKARSGQESFFGKEECRNRLDGKSQCRVAMAASIAWVWCPDMPE